MKPRRFVWWPRITRAPVLGKHYVRWGRKLWLI